MSENISALIADARARGLQYAINDLRGYAHTIRDTMSRDGVRLDSLQSWASIEVALEVLESLSAPAATDDEREALEALIQGEDERWDGSKSSEDFSTRVAGAVLAAGFRRHSPLTPEAAPSDTDREALLAQAEQIGDALNGVLVDAGVFDSDAVEEYNNLINDLVNAVLAAVRASQPVQVEVTTATLQRLREAVYAQTGNHTYLSIEQAENVLVALGGGDQ